MISETARKLLEEIFSPQRKFARDVPEEVKNDPEVYLISLLIAIKERDKEISSMLGSTLVQATYGSNREKAQKLLQEVS